MASTHKLGIPLLRIISTFDLTTSEGSIGLDRAGSNRWVGPPNQKPMMTFKASAGMNLQAAAIRIYKIQVGPCCSIGRIESRVLLVGQNTLNRALVKEYHLRKFDAALIPFLARTQPLKVEKARIVLPGKTENQIVFITEFKKAV